MTPKPQPFTTKEWKIICQHRTPYQVQQFLNALPYNQEKNKETLHSFRRVVRLGAARTDVSGEMVIIQARPGAEHLGPVLVVELGRSSASAPTVPVEVAQITVDAVARRLDDVLGRDATGVDQAEFLERLEEEDALNGGDHGFMIGYLSA